MQKIQFLYFLVFALALSACSKPKEDDTPGTPTAGYNVITVSNGGSVSGHVTLAGEHPKVEQIETQKDQDVCGTAHPDPSSLDTGNGIRGCVVCIEHMGQGKVFAPGKLEVDQVACTYTPHVLVAPVGSTLIVKNSDHVIHNFHISKGSTTITNEAQPEGSPAREVVLSSPGLLSVTCDVHPWMHSFLYVVTNPYYTVTDTAGAFSIDNIPTGDYTLSLWRDNWSLQTVKDAEGRIQSYNRGPDFQKKQQIHIEAGKVTPIDFTLP